MKAVADLVNEKQFVPVPYTTVIPVVNRSGIGMKAAAIEEIAATT